MTRTLTSVLALLMLSGPLSGCVTVSPYGPNDKEPTVEAMTYAEELLARPPESLTEEEVEYLSLYALQAEARNTQARAEFEQTVFFVSLGITIATVLVSLAD
ncbi:hypothetical protein [Rubrivirga sp.]|uniref:hypothetical protein n=1 Tax=Rubrivirga sp. TaxID=1885344 RepID=UPI003C72CE67